MRSQDRESIFKVKSIFYSTNDENEHLIRSIIVDDVKNGIIKLGQYSTKERALEVLDEIQRLMKASLIGKNLDGYGVVIYQMPIE